MKKAILLILLVSSCDSSDEPSDIWVGKYEDSVYTYTIESEVAANYEYNGLLEISGRFIATLKCDEEASHIDCSGQLPDNRFYDIGIWLSDGKYTVKWGSEDHEALRKL